MAVTLTFEGEQIGDHLVKAEPADQLLTPPAKRTGLYQPRGAINAESRNYLFGRRYTVTLTRSNPVLLSQALLAIQELMGRTGDIEATFGANVERLEGWTIEDISVPALAPGFGGRHAPEVVIVAFGATRPVYS